MSSLGNDFAELLKALKESKTDCNFCPFRAAGSSVGEFLVMIGEITKRQQDDIEECKAILTELSNIGYCHNFQLERSDIVDYINAVSEVVKKAKNKLEGNNGT